MRAVLLLSETKKLITMALLELQINALFNFENVHFEPEAARLQAIKAEQTHFAHHQ